MQENLGYTVRPYFKNNTKGWGHRSVISISAFERWRQEDQSASHSYLEESVGDRACLVPICPPDNSSNNRLSGEAELQEEHLPATLKALDLTLRTANKTRPQFFCFKYVFYYLSLQPDFCFSSFLLPPFPVPTPSLLCTLIHSSSVSIQKILILQASCYEINSFPPQNSYAGDLLPIFEDIFFFTFTPFVYGGMRTEEPVWSSEEGHTQEEQVPPSPCGSWGLNVVGRAFTH